MLVTDPKSRATLPEIMAHPWLNKGCSGPPENYLPHREPLQLPLDKKVIDKMTGFDFGSADYITTELEAVIKSENYQKAVQQAAQRLHPSTNDAERKKSGMFDFGYRRKASSNKDTLSPPSTESIAPEDPVNAFSPLISIYYLVREKQEREKKEVNPGALAMPQSPGEKPLQLPDLPPPQPAFTNPATYEMPGEAPTGGRARPRARTHGEDEVQEQLEKAAVPPTTPVRPSAVETTPVKRENAAVGLLRRFSTRRGRNTDQREKSAAPSPVAPSPAPAPTVEITEPESMLASSNKRLSIRKTRERDAPPSAFTKYASNHPELLSPPLAEEPQEQLNLPPPTKTRGLSLGRSTSVNSSDIMRRFSRRGTSESRVPQLASQRESMEQNNRSTATSVNTDSMPISNNERIATSRTKSTGSAARESVQIRRTVREQQQARIDLPEETDQDLAEYAAADSHGEGQEIKPVFLKGLFSVSTTSSKPLSFIRADIIRVLRQLGVEYREIKGGFTCRRMASVDVRKPVDSPQQEVAPRASMAVHRRRISFAGLRGTERERDEPPTTPKTPRQPILENGSTNSEESDEEAQRRQDVASTPRLPAGETTTHVQNDMNQGNELVFEILVVKVPLFTLHGLQFKKVDGNTWQYKQMATTILGDLKL